MESQPGLATTESATGVQDETVSDRVIDGVSEATGLGPLELNPLYDVIDPDALNAIFSPANGRQPTDAELRFTMEGCEVLVEGDGNVVVTPPADRDEPDQTTVQGAE